MEWKETGPDNSYLDCCRIVCTPFPENIENPERSWGLPGRAPTQNDCPLLKISCRNQRMPASSLCHLWRRHFRVYVAQETINRNLIQHGYRAQRMTTDPRLTVCYWVAQLQWVRRNRRWQLGHWRHVIFTDGSCYILDCTDGWRRVQQLQARNSLMTVSKKSVNKVEAQ